MGDDGNTNCWLVFIFLQIFHKQRRTQAVSSVRCVSRFVSQKTTGASSKYSSRIIRAAAPYLPAHADKRRVRALHPVIRKVSGAVACAGWFLSVLSPAVCGISSDCLPIVRSGLSSRRDFERYQGDLLSVKTGREVLSARISVLR